MSDHREISIPTDRSGWPWLEAAVDYLTVVLAVGAAAVLIGVVV